MAVHEDYPGLKVEVVVDDKPLHEYDKAEKFTHNGSHVIRYVEALAGTEFAITLEFDKPLRRDRGMVCRVLADGNSIASPIIDTNFRKWPYKRCVSSVTRFEGSQITANKLCFGHFEVVDGVDGLSAVDCLHRTRSLGQIEMSVVFAHFTQAVNTVRKPRNLPELGPVPESALKGDVRSLVSMLSKPKRAENKEIFAVLKFKYRSRANLQALHVLPSVPKTTLSAPGALRRFLLTPESVDSLARKVQPSLPFRRPSTFMTTPTLPLRRPASTFEDCNGGLTEEDLIALISHYRGTSEGLANQGRARLQVLLKHYKKKDPVPSSQRTGARQERSNDIGLKRQCESEDSGTRERKRSKPDVIVLDA
ncbi:hypothetical protein SVAN01_08023 [Stagonosporopsis vannaccii]|nr:hypothetical protein SVAN01_08023 [Stagonosporopsis vannaccii]